MISLLSLQGKHWQIAVHIKESRETNVTVLEHCAVCPSSAAVSRPGSQAIAVLISFIQYICACSVNITTFGNKFIHSECVGELKLRHQAMNLPLLIIR